MLRIIERFIQSLDKSKKRKKNTAPGSGIYIQKYEYDFYE